MKIIWTIIAAIGVATALWLGNSWRFIWSSDGQEFATSLGLILSLIGLFCAIIGFTVTLQQLRKTRSASEAVESTLNQIKSKLSTISATSEIERSRVSLEETQRHAFALRWQNIKYSLSPARDSFVRIRELDLELFADLSGRLESSADEMGKLIDAIEGDDKDSKSKATALLRQYIDLSNKMHVRIGQG